MEINEVVPAIEVVGNNKVDIDIVAPEFINEGKGKAIETTATEEKSQDKTSEESLDLADPTDTPVHQRGTSVRLHPSVRKANKRSRRRAEKAAMEAALNAPSV
jgi:hypothetical protein